MISSLRNFLKDLRPSRKITSKLREKINFSNLTSSEEPRMRGSLKRSQMKLGINQTGKTDKELQIAF